MHSPRAFNAQLTTLSSNGNRLDGRAAYANHKVGDLVEDHMRGLPHQHMLASTSLEYVNSQATISTKALPMRKQVSLSGGSHLGLDKGNLPQHQEGVASTQHHEPSLAQAKEGCFSDYEAKTQRHIIDEPSSKLASAQGQALMVEDARDMMTLPHTKPLLPGKPTPEGIITSDDGESMSKSGAEKEKLLVAPSNAISKESGSSQGHNRTLPPAAAMLRDYQEHLSEGLERLPSSSSTSVHASRCLDSKQEHGFGKRASLPLDGHPKVLDVAKLDQHPR